MLFCGIKGPRTPNRALNPTVQQQRFVCCCPAGYRERYAAVGRGGLLRGAQQRIMAHGQDLPAQGAAEVF